MPFKYNPISSQFDLTETGGGGGTVVGPGVSVVGDVATWADITGTTLADSGKAFSTDGTLAANSDALVPTQKAIKTYADTKQPLDATLTSIALLGTAADKTIYTTGIDTWAETTLTAFSRSLLDDADQATWQASLAITPGSDVQPYSAALTSIASLVTAGNEMIYTTGADTYALTGLTSYARGLLNDPNAAAARTTLGLTAVATQTVTQYDVLVGGAANAISSIGPGSAGQVLRSGGAGANPAYSTATYPAIATGTGTLLRADGTNWVATTLTLPDTVAINDVLYASAANILTARTSTANRVFITNSSGVPSWASTVDVNFSISGSAAGGTRSLTCQNTSNTSGSNGVIAAVTSGSSAGDPVFKLETGVTTFCMGLDNSVTSPSADPWKLSNNTIPGTNDIIIAYTSGEINYPLQPTFLGYLGTTATNKTGNGAVYTIGTDALTEVFDQSSDFTTAGVFTAPVTGIYDLRAQVTVTGNTIATTFVISIVTTARTYTYTFTKAAGSQDESVAISALADMTATNTATVTITVSGEAGDTSDIKGGATLETFFCGHLVA